MPEPRDDESHDDWIDRCMSDEEQKDSFPDKDQRYAVCQSKWDKHQKKESPMPDDSRYLKAPTKSNVFKVDRENGVLKGYVVAQMGPFKTPGRGEFNQKGLDLIVKLGNKSPKGLRSRFSHPSMSSDALGKFLGRSRDFFMSTTFSQKLNKKVPAVRADLHFSKTALGEPVGGGKPQGAYVMDLAEEDPDAISSSLVLAVDEEYRTNKDGTPEKGEDGEPLPPLWFPTELFASDIVDEGDAVDGLLSAPELAEALSVGLTPELKKLLRFDRVQRLGCQLLDGMFPKAGKEEIERRCRNWLGEYLSLRFPPAEAPKISRPLLEGRKSKLDQMAKTLAILNLK